MVSLKKKDICVNTFIDYDRCNALNIEGTESIKEVFGFGGVAKSNKEEPEIIVNIVFKEKVHISGIMVEAFDEGNNLLKLDCLPADLHLFSNNSSISFSDIGVSKATESIKIGANLSKIMELKVAKFRNTSDLSVKFH